jgi:hypothetical protein
MKPTLACIPLTFLAAAPCPASAVAPAAVPAARRALQEPTAPEPPAAAEARPPAAGDLDKIAWARPFARAQELAQEQGRVLLVKPILGGSNKPSPGGVACGGTNDCEGSW